MNIFNWKSSFNFGGSELVRLPRKIKDMFCSRSDAALNEVLFYGAEDEEQRRQVGLNNLLCIYYVLHARDTLDLCAPSLASDTIVKSLINVKQKGGSKIRIAIYHSVDYENLKTVAKYGIEVKAISSAVQLEHEFILIDGYCADAVAVIGSVDYELSRVNCNRDTTVITSEPNVVSTLQREFERIWNSAPEILK